MHFNHERLMPEALGALEDLGLLAPLLTLELAPLLSRTVYDKPEYDTFGVGIVAMGSVTGRIKEWSYFLILDRCKIPIKAINPTVIPIKKPITAINFVPNH